MLTPVVACERPTAAHAQTAIAFALAVAVRLDPGIRCGDARQQSIGRLRERLEHSGVLERCPIRLHDLGLEFGRGADPFPGASKRRGCVPFAAGALAGFTLIGLLVHSRLRATDETHSATDRTLAGALHWFAIGAALGAVALIAEIPSWVAWPLGMFTATSIYLLGASLQLAVVVSRRSRR